MITNDSNSHFPFHAIPSPVAKTAPYEGTYDAASIVDYVLSQSATTSLEKLRKEGEVALANFFETHREQLRSLITINLDKRLASRLDSSDIIQDLYLECRNRLKSYLQEPQIPPLAWLRKLSRQVTSVFHRRHLRTKKRDARRETRSLDSSRDVPKDFFLADSTSSVGSKIARNEEQKQVIDAIKNLSELDRTVLELKHFEDLSWNEIADRLGVPIETAKKRYRRALQRLKVSTAEDE